MSPDKRSQLWLKELEAFLKQDEVAPPHSVTEVVCAQVQGDLNPSLQYVSAKLFGLHTLAAAIVTFFCPQLGVGPIMGGQGIMHFFMVFGPLPCAALCGALFLGASAMMATFFLRKEELRLANRYGFINVSLLAAVSFAALMLAGGASDRWSYAFWIAGAILSGWIILRIGANVRLRPNYRGWSIGSPG